MRNLKIVLSVLFVLGVSFFVVRSCVHKKPLPPYPKGRGGVPVVRRAPRAKAPAPGRARMAIILDDWGNNERLLRLACDIHEPLTLSILPHLIYSRTIAQEAKAEGLGVMLHMPMEPKSVKAPLEPYTILTGMEEKDIQNYLQSALRSVPGAEGVNNHEGSKATSDLRVMRIVLNQLKLKGLFFIDSAVISTTVGPQVAREIGIPFAKRDVFIDNEMKTDLIRKQLERAKGIALRRGRVVVIGHDREMTLRVLKEVAAEFEKQGIQFVFVKDLVQGGSGSTA